MTRYPRAHFGNKSQTGELSGESKTKQKQLVNNGGGSALMSGLSAQWGCSAVLTQVMENKCMDFWYTG